MKTTFKTIFFILIALPFTLFSCSSDEESTPSNSKSTDVYIVGITRNSANKAIPTIWKNGVPTILPSDTNINTTGFKIAVSGNDVYAINGNFDEADAILLWKNGISSVVAENAIAEDLIVENGDVYILGRIGNSFRYWKNGVETILTNGLSNNFVSDMVVSNGNVHITGSENNGAKNVVKYWKNGAATTVSNPNFRAFANGIDVDGNDVTVNSTKPFAISAIVGVTNGVSEVPFTMVPTVLIPVVFVHIIEFASFTVITSGKVNVSAHIVTSFEEATIVGFL